MFHQVGVGADFTGTVLTIDGVENYGVADLPVDFLWVVGDDHSFAYHSPLTGDTGKRYVWDSTGGLSTQQSETIIVPVGGGFVTGHYRTQVDVTFDQSGVGSDFTGTVLTVDGVDYGVADLPVTLTWDIGTPHFFAYYSPLNVDSGKRYVWTSTTGGLSTAQSDPSFIAPDDNGSVTGNYKTQYLLIVLTDPAGLSPQPTEAPLGDPEPAIANSWWYDDGIPVELTAESVVGYNFKYWEVGGTYSFQYLDLNNNKQFDPGEPYSIVITGDSVSYPYNPITVIMNMAHIAIAHYQKEITRTQGFWATHRAFTWGKWTTEIIGSKTIDTAPKLFGAFWSNIAKTSKGKSRLALDQARIQLLQQLVAAILNVKTFGDDDSGTGTGLIAAGKAAFSGTNSALILSIALQLDAFNNWGGIEPLPVGMDPGSANSQEAQLIADKLFWDILP